MKNEKSEQAVLNYYAVCHKLKDTIRTGWMKWGVKRERLESVAEHIFGTQMLAIAMKSEYGYNVDILRVVYMLAVHELGEALIGDFTPFDISRTEKEKLEHAAVYEVLSGLVDKTEIFKLFEEFDAHETADAKFAHWCDKLECDLQCKIYGDAGCVDLGDQSGNEIMNNPDVKALMAAGNSWSDMFMKYDQQKVDYDQNFLAVSKYAMEHGVDIPAD